MHWLDKFLLYTITDQDIVLLIPYSCWAMVRNSNSINKDFTEDTITTWLERCLFLLFLAVVLGFLTLQDKYNIRICRKIYYSFFTRCETGQKSSLFYQSLKVVQINFIFCDNVRIRVLSISQTDVTYVCLKDVVHKDIYAIQFMLRTQTVLYNFILLIWNTITICITKIIVCHHLIYRGRRGRDRMVVVFTTIYAISAYHHWCCEFKSRTGRGVQHYVIKFVSDLRQVSGFLWVLRFPPPIKLTATI